MMVLAQMVVELLRGKGQNWIKSEFRVRFDPEGQGQSAPKTTGFLNKSFHIF